jgi:hypothetical protein
MKISTLVKLALVAILVAGSSTLLAQTGSDAKTWGDVVNGLQSSISIGPAQPATPQIPTLIFAARNVGSSMIVITLGYGGCTMPWPQPGIETTAVTLSLTGADGTTQVLHDFPGSRFAGACAGAAIVETRVPLPAGAYFSTPINLDYYYVIHDAHPLPLDRGWKPGGIYSLHAQVGELSAKSNELQIKFPAQ